jgi:hypothetical protein
MLFDYAALEVGAIKGMKSHLCGYMGRVTWVHAKMRVRWGDKNLHAGTDRYPQFENKYEYL